MPKKPQKSSKGQIISGNISPKKPWYRRPGILITIAVLVVIIAAIGASVYCFQIRPYNQVAVNINGTAFNMRYFVNSLEAYYKNAPSDTGIAEFADYVEQQIEQNQNIIQGSAALGVVIPRSEVVSELSLAHLPLNQEHVDIRMSSDLISKQVPLTQPQYNIQAMLVESEAQAQTALARLSAGENFTAVSGELNRYSSDSVSPDILGWVTPRLADLMLVSTRFGDNLSANGAVGLGAPFYDDSVSKKYGYWIVEVTEKKYASDNVTLAGLHLKGLLAGNPEDAQDVAAKLNSGVDIDELAKQVSQMPGAADNGAELGWVSPTIGADLFDTLSDAPLNAVNAPIGDALSVTAGGYWVYNILEKDDNRALNEYQQNQLETDLATRCTAALKKNPDYKVENLLTQEMKDFALDKVVLAQGAGSVLIGIIALPIGEVGVPYDYPIKIYGEKSGNTWSIEEGVLPDGLSFDTAKGILSGTPTVAGGGGITFKVGNNLHYHTLELTINIRMAISITTDSLLDGKVGEKYDQMVEAFADANKYTWSMVEGTLPDGLTLDAASGTIGGTPTASGTFSITVQVDDGIGKATKALTLKIQ
jgi:hypothetical protein